MRVVNSVGVVEPLRPNALIKHRLMPDLTHWRI